MDKDRMTVTLVYGTISGGIIGGVAFLDRYLKYLWNGPWEAEWEHETGQVVQGVLANAVGGFCIWFLICWAVFFAFYKFYESLSESKEFESSENVKSLWTYDLWKSVFVGSALGSLIVLIALRLMWWEGMFLGGAVACLFYVIFTAARPRNLSCKKY